MISLAKRIIHRTTNDKKLRTLLFTGLVFIILNVLFETKNLSFLPHNTWIELAFRFAGHVGDILLLAFLFGLVFDYNERLTLMNEIADQLGFLGAVSRVGIRDFNIDPRNMSHENEIANSEKFIVCIRGSKQFFTNGLRSALIIDRLKSGKEILVICHHEKLENIEELKRELAASGADVDNFRIETHDCNLMYNFLDVDEGLWIKTYYHQRHDLLYAPPAFFVATNSDLWVRYQRDIEIMLKKRVP